MVFEKRMIVLSGDGVTKGTLKTERGLRGLTASLAVFGLEKGRYALAVACGGNVRFYPFPDAPPYKFVLSADTDVTAAHFAVCAEGGGAVMYGTLSKHRLSRGEMPKWRGNEADNENESDVAPSPKSDDPSVNDECCARGDCGSTAEKEDEPQYDDEAIAEENYFERENTLFVGIEEENACKTAPEVPTEIPIVTPIEKLTVTPTETEAPCAHPVEQKSERAEEVVVTGRKMTFYEKNKDAIDGLFERGEREKALESLLPKTKWVKVNYDEGRHYVVGVIGDEPDYICYGLPAIYSADPPVGLDGYTQWLPLDVRSPHGKGYWVLYQSAISGETVRRRPL